MGGNGVAGETVSGGGGDGIALGRIVTSIAVATVRSPPPESEAWG
jgi:hypothetical protein